MADNSHLADNSQEISSLIYSPKNLFTFQSVIYSRISALRVSECKYSHKLDKMTFLRAKIGGIFSNFYMKTYFVVAHWKRLSLFQ